jgi:hypothetical protein
MKKIHPLGKVSLACFISPQSSVSVLILKVLIAGPSDVGRRTSHRVCVASFSLSRQPSSILTSRSSIHSESGTIVDYLFQTYSPTPPAFNIKDSYFSHYAEGSLMLFLQMGITLTGAGGMAPWYVKPVIDGFVGKIKVSQS